MTTPWTAPGLTPEERARAIAATDHMDQVGEPSTFERWITAAIRAAVADMERRAVNAEGRLAFAEEINRNFEKAIDEAVAAERERAAKIVDADAEDYRARGQHMDADNAERLARAIRRPTSGAAAGGES